MRTAVKNRLIEGINKGVHKIWNILKGAVTLYMLAIIETMKKIAPMIIINTLITRSNSRAFANLFGSVI